MRMILSFCHIHTRLVLHQTREEVGTTALLTLVNKTVIRNLVNTLPMRYFIAVREPRTRIFRKLCTLLCSRVSPRRFLGLQFFKSWQMYRDHCCGAHIGSGWMLATVWWWYAICIQRSLPYVRDPVVLKSEYTKVPKKAVLWNRNRNRNRRNRNFLPWGTGTVTR